ncbi:hypothetical protein GCM10010446_69030 [Streptomyces enissocaesilis]|uniref:Uncharacterized protein n=1 Tax=Streptomyces enissocaesilis TaxID=332589 RepID=A0ABN3XP35_9ACTN
MAAGSGLADRQCRQRIVVFDGELQVREAVFLEMEMLPLRRLGQHLWGNPAMPGRQVRVQGTGARGASGGVSRYVVMLRLLCYGCKEESSQPPPIARHRQRPAPWSQLRQSNRSGLSKNCPPFSS